MGKHRPHGGPGEQTLAGVVRDINFAPHGGVEGVLLDTAGGVVQVNLPPHAAAGGWAAGRAVTLAVTPDHGGTHGPGDHPVYHLVAADGEPAGDDPDAVVRVEGVVARLNYARHGEPNGVVLDTGDFVHLKPHGMRAVGLAVGDRVLAAGTARPTATGRRAVEAAVVNGVAVGHTKPHHH